MTTVQNEPGEYLRTYGPLRTPEERAINQKIMDKSYEYIGHVSTCNTCRYKGIERCEEAVLLEITIVALGRA